MAKVNGRSAAAQYGDLKRRTWRQVYLALNTNTGQVHATLITHQNVADGDALGKLLDQISRDEQIDVIGGEGAYDTKPCGHCCMQGCSFDSATGGRATHWPADTPGVVWRNGAVDTIARDCRRKWKKNSSYHQRSLAENAMYRFKTLTGNCLWARHIDAQSTSVACAAA